MFGDNQSVVTSSTVPQSKLSKRHYALSYHCVKEALAACILSFHHINGVDNPADILSKHWGYSTIWHLLQPIMFYQGDMMALLTATDTPPQTKGE